MKEEDDESNRGLIFFLFAFRYFITVDDSKYSTRVPGKPSRDIFTLAAAISTDEVDLSNWSEEFRIIHGASAFVC